MKDAKFIKPLTITTTVVFVFSAGGTWADPSPVNFGGNGGAWVEDWSGHFVNQNNPDNRKDLPNGRKAIPGKAAAAQAANPTTKDSANNVISRPNSTLVDPHRSLQ